MLQDKNLIETRKSLFYFSNTILLVFTVIFGCGGGGSKTNNNHLFFISKKSRLTNFTKNIGIPTTKPIMHTNRFIWKNC
jgi:hypothetical protein